MLFHAGAAGEAPGGADRLQGIAGLGGGDGAGMARAGPGGSAPSPLAPSAVDELVQAGQVADLCRGRPRRGLLGGVEQAAQEPSEVARLVADGDFETDPRLALAGGLRVGLDDAAPNVVRIELGGVRFVSRGWDTRIRWGGRGGLSIYFF